MIECNFGAAEQAREDRTYLVFADIEGKLDVLRGREAL